MAGALEGLKVLDFTTLLPGPYATMILADLGADVLSVSSAGRPDMTTLIPPFIEGTDLTAAQAYLGRGKRSIHLNLKNSKAREVIDRLLGSYDILIEQFRPDVMEKFGLSYNDLCAEHPRLIYCSLTGYGSTGSMRHRAGHDINFLALSGLMGYTGHREGGPVPLSLQVADVAAGSNNAVIAILAAVISRSRTGKGQHLDISMTDGAAAFNALWGASFLASGENPEREKVILNGGSLYDFYETADGEYISVGSLEPKFFAAFCKAIGRSDLISGGVMPTHTAGVKEEVRRIIGGKTRAHWEDVFSAVDACVEPVLSLAEAMNGSMARERDWVVEVALPDGGFVKQPACPLKFSATPPQYGTAGTKAGAHTTDVLINLGYGEEDIDELARTGLFT